MSLHTPPLWIQAGSYSATEDRQLISAMFSRAGLVGVNDMNVTQTGTASMAVVISSGRAIVQGTTIANQGMYSVFSDGNDTKTVTTSNPTNPRIDIVVVTVRDAAITGANNDVIYQVIAGTPSGSPVQPSTPADSLLLATISVGAGVTSITNANITNIKQRSAVPNGIIPVQSATERNALTTTDGQRVYRLDLHAWETNFNGTFLPDRTPMPASGLLHAPRRQLIRTATFSLANNVLTAIGSWTTDSGDDGNGTGLSILSTQITASYTGLYHVNFTLQFVAGGGAGVYRTELLVNGAIGPPATGTVVGWCDSGTGTACTNVISRRVFLNAGDTIQPAVLQTTGSSQTVGSTVPGIVVWQMEWLSQ